MIVDVSHSDWNIEVNIFSNNRTNSLAKRQAFAHCCELPQVWRKCFPKQSRNAKVYGKMFTFIILIMIISSGRCYITYANTSHK